MQKGYAQRLALWLLDVGCVAISFLIATNLRFDEPVTTGIATANRAVLATMVIMTVVLNFAVHDNHGFMSRSGVRELGHAIRYSLLLVLGVAVASYVFRIDPSPSRLMLVGIFFVNVIVMCAGRWVAKVAARAAYRGEGAGSPIIMITSAGLRQEVERRFRLGMTYRIVGWLTLEGGHVEGMVEQQEISCQTLALPEALHAIGVEEVPDFFVHAPHESERGLMQVVDAVERYGTSCHVSIEMPDPKLQGARLGYFGEMPVVTYVGRGSAFYRRYVKRAIDIVFSLLVIALAFIPGVLLAIVISVQSKGSPFYSQERLGKNGRHFRLYKFRSMVSDADDVEKYFTPEQLETWHRERKVDDDPRITRIGRVLRKTSLDEFPQFLNVLKGDMSVVGPRPIVDEEIHHYGNREPEFLSVRPGLTGWWQVMARNSATYEDGSRQELELYYVRHASFTLDWNIVKRTFGAVFGGTGQ